MGGTFGYGCAVRGFGFRGLGPRGFAPGNYLFMIQHYIKVAWLQTELHLINVLCCKGTPPSEQHGDALGGDAALATQVNVSVPLDFYNVLIILI